MPKETFRQLHGAKPFLALSSAAEKLAVLKDTSILKLSKRTQKALEKENQRKNRN